MRNIILLSAIFITIITGCSSDPKKEKTNVVADCVFPNTESSAPGWICGEPVDAVAVGALGVAEPSIGGVSFMIDIAVADGRARLAEQMQVQVSKMVKKYL